MNIKDMAYSTPKAKTAKGLYEQLLQLMTVTKDGDLLSHQGRDEAVKKGFAQRYQGYNWITENGIKKLISGGYIKD